MLIYQRVWALTVKLRVVCYWSFSESPKPKTNSWARHKKYKREPSSGKSGLVKVLTNINNKKLCRSVIEHIIPKKKSAKIDDLSPDPKKSWSITGRDGRDRKERSKLTSPAIVPSCRLHLDHWKEVYRGPCGNLIDGMWYPLVNKRFAIENGPVEIVDPFS